MSVLTVVEEHHEAFIVWRWAKDFCALPATGNYLLHIDEHADLAPLRSALPVPPFDAPFRETVNFTYAHLGIGNFIVPAIAAGLISAMTWVQLSSSTRVGTVEVINIEGVGLARRVYFGEVAFEKGEANAGRKHVPLNIVGPGSREDLGATTLLDIDLDYFSCAESHWTALSGREIEITEHAYRQICADRYHFMRLTCESLVPCDLGGKYVLRVLPPPTVKLPQRDIASSVSSLKSFLVENRVSPRIITVCRSRLSGYTPPEHCATIESSVITMLTELYRPDIVSFDGLSSNRLENPHGQRLGL